MRLSNPIEALSASLFHASLVALPEVVQELRDFEATATWTMTQRKEAQLAEARGEAVYPVKTVRERPRASDCEVLALFPEVWGSTALGFGGLGGAAMTPAYTVVVQGPGRQLAVYWAGSFAYLVDPAKQTDAQRAAFAEDLSARRTAARRSAFERYAAEIDTVDKG